MYIHELYSFLLYMLVKLSAVCLVTLLNFYLLTYLRLPTTMHKTSVESNPLHEPTVLQHHPCQGVPVALFS